MSFDLRNKQMKRIGLVTVGTLCVFAAFGDLAESVNPFVGTDTVGHTYPAACVPFGMVQAGPDTGTMDWKYCSGYQWGDTNVLGFSQTHLNGTGCPGLGDVQILPFSGTVRTMPMKSAFRKANEKAKPGCYATYLDTDAVQVEIAAEKRGALYRFRFDKGQAKVLFNLPFAIAEAWTHPETSDAWMVRRGKRELIGSLTHKNWIPSRRVAFAVAFDRDLTDFVRLEEPVKGVPRYVAEFSDLKSGETVQMKIALSMTSVGAAERNLAAMRPGFAFEAVRAAARAEWNEILARMTCEGSEAERMNFYTAVYHLCQQPNDYSDAGEEIRLTNLSIWDTFRAAQPLYTIMAPEIADGTVNACLRHGRENGELPVMSYGGKALYCMVGNHSVPMIVDWFLKCGASRTSPPTTATVGADRRAARTDGAVRDSVGADPRAARRDWESAYQQIKETLTQPHAGKIKEEWDLYDRYGYYPYDLVYGESVSRTLECGYDDWCAAQMAKALGHEEDYRFFMKRSEGWKRVYDAATGFMRGRDSNGRWRTPFDPYAMGHGADTSNDFTEGNAFQYMWHVLQDAEGLVSAMGGRDSFAKKLDAIFVAPDKVSGEGLTVDVTGLIGQYVHGNEPSHHVIYFYPQVGHPEKAAERIREVFDKFYFPAPDGLCGNEDCGQMSAWYLFSAMGFYPFNPCGGEYIIGAPQLPRVTLRHTNTFTVIANGLSKDCKYVKSVTLNGKPITNWKIRHEDIMKGGELVFEMEAR